MEMEHEPMLHDGSSDITNIQPIENFGEHDNIQDNSRHFQAGGLDLLNPWLHGQFVNPLLFYPYSVAASLPFFTQSAASLSPLLANMGNEASHSGHGGHHHAQITVDGEVYDVPKVQRLIQKLKNELSNAQEETEKVRSEYLAAQQTILSKDALIGELNEEIDKLKCVIQQKVMGGKPDILAVIQEDATMAGTMAGTEVHTKKKQGVSGECSKASLANIDIKQHKKDCSAKHLIKTALRNNDFLKNLGKNQVHEIVSCMHEVIYKEGDYIVREHEGGNHFYVSAEGFFQVLKGGEVIGQMGPGRAFGELAILYGCTRTASVKAVTTAKVWALERTVFQAIMMRTGLERQNQRIEFLKSVPSFANLSKNKLAKVADVLEADSFEEGEHIIREGQVGDTFYIIEDGQVSVMQRIMGMDEPQQIRILSKGDYFGEKALLTEERRTASVIALHPGVEVLTLSRDAFTAHIGDLKEFHERDYGDLKRRAEWKNSVSAESDVNSNTSLEQKRISIESEFKNVDLRDFEVITTLGIGGFGRVELVRRKDDKTRSYAMKCLKKKHIIDTRQVAHVYNEKKIMLTCSSPFIVKLHRTFKDKKFVYMLMEVCLGGELWTVLRDKGHFDDHTARFCVSCVLEAFQYLHSRAIVYRDLKPENLLVTNTGYIKLVDFGFAKHVQPGKKTWTFCGTPEYVAPEIILNKGHDHAVDIWAIGILIFELTTGLPPFTASDPMRTYNMILRGIDALEFPRKVSKNAQSLIKRLCRENPSERLGYQKDGLSDIMKHKWFQGFDWEGLRDMTLVPPFKQKVHSPTDACNFDNYPGEIEMPPDELSGWDEEF